MKEHNPFYRYADEISIQFFGILFKLLPSILRDYLNQETARKAILYEYRDLQKIYPIPLKTDYETIEFADRYLEAYERNYGKTGFSVD